MTLGCRLPPSARAASASSAPHATAFTSPTTPCVNAWMSSTTSSGISSSAQLQPAPCEASAQVRARFLQREAREPLVHGARERTAVVLGQQVRDELLVAGEHEDVDDRPPTEPQLRKHLELAQSGRREALEAIDDDVRVAPVAGLVTSRTRRGCCAARWRCPRPHPDPNLRAAGAATARSSRRAGRSSSPIGRGAFETAAAPASSCRRPPDPLKNRQWICLLKRSSSLSIA